VQQGLPERPGRRQTDPPPPAALERAFQEQPVPVLERVTHQAQQTGHRLREQEPAQVPEQPVCRRELAP
jgi:hypothetical protein